MEVRRFMVMPSIFSHLLNVCCRLEASPEHRQWHQAQSSGSGSKIHHQATMLQKGLALSAASALVALAIAGVFLGPRWFSPQQAAIPEGLAARPATVVTVPTVSVLGIADQGVPLAAEDKVTLQPLLHHLPDTSRKSDMLVMALAPREHYQSVLVVLGRPTPACPACPPQVLSARLEPVQNECVHIISARSTYATLLM